MRTTMAATISVALVCTMSVASAAQEADAPLTNETLLAGMVTEEVEAGVHRVTNDGVREFSPMEGGTWKKGLRAGDDGTVWLVRDRWFARLGEDTRHDLPAVKSIYGGLSPRDIEFASDGTVWAITRGRKDGAVGVLRSYDGERWERRSPRRIVDVADVEIGPDGTVWATWTRADEKGKTFVGTVGPDGLERVAVARGEPGLEGFAITQEGDPLLHLDSPYSSPGPMRASRYTGGSWQDVRADGAGMTAIGPDGAVWFLSMAEPPHVDSDGNEYAEAIPLDTLMRFDAGARQEWGTIDGLPSFGSGYRTAGDIGASPEGSLWVTYPRLTPDASDSRHDELEYDGIARFDGTEWTRYLPGHVVHIGAILPDGAVWVTAGLQPDEGCCWPDTYDIYVIDPLPSAATE